VTRPTTAVPNRDGKTAPDPAVVDGGGGAIVCEVTSIVGSV